MMFGKNTALSNYSKAVLLLLIFSTCSFSFTGAYASKQPTVRLIHQHEWYDLVAQVHSVKDVATENKLRMLKNGKVIFKYAASAWSVASIHSLDDGNLATIWVAGCGNIRNLVVFGYSKGKVRVVLKAQSHGMDPEYIYNLRGNAMGSDKVLPSYQQRIVVPQTEWNETQQLVAVSADIFTWNPKTGKYKVQKNVPWTKRFKYL